MCTVTYIPVYGGFVLTSSRDEKIHRPTLKPSPYNHMNKTIIYPKDILGGGTWIAADITNKAACLLNGAYTNHIKNDSYLKSRGTVLLESFSYENTEEFTANVNLKNVEPFTLLLFESGKSIHLKELVWDGMRKHLNQIDTTIPKIWSSATLYSKKDRVTRNHWFDLWLHKYGDYPENNILGFHKVKHTNNFETNVLMRRNNGLQTLSITQIKVNKNTSDFFYYDLQDNSKSEINITNIICTPGLQ